VVPSETSRNFLVVVALVEDGAMIDADVVVELVVDVAVVDVLTAHTWAVKLSQPDTHA
jgi:hypothetical protein